MIEFNVEVCILMEKFSFYCLRYKLNYEEIELWREVIGRNIFMINLLK